MFLFALIATILTVIFNIIAYKLIAVYYYKYYKYKTHNCNRILILREPYMQLYSPLGQQHNYNNKGNKSISIRNN